MTRRGKRPPTPKAPWLQTDAQKAEAEAKGKAPASPARVDEDVVADTMAMAGGLLMSVFGRSKKNGRGRFDTALVDIQVLGIADKARKALDAGLEVVLLVEDVKGRGCVCPHCQAPTKPVQAPCTIRHAPEPAAAATADDHLLDLGKASYIAKLELRDSWRKIACDPECGGNWGTGCPGCHLAIPEHFKALWKVAQLAKEAARHLPTVGDDMGGDNATACELAKELGEALKAVGIEPGEEL